jgi:3-dehydroquinate dehydratase
MALRQKINKRKEYNLSKTDGITYEKSRILKKINFLILRGPGFVQMEVIEENNAIKKLGISQHFKIKLVQVKDQEEAIEWIKDANTWAGGIVYNPGEMEDEGQLIQKTIKKILIPVQTISSLTEATEEDYLSALKILIKKPSKK